MKYLVDTDWVAAHFAGDADASRVLAALLDEGLAISIITYGELFEAVLYSIRSAAVHAAFLEFLRWARVLALDEPTMRRFAGIRGSLRRREELISDPDLLIAATALHHDLTLVTSNVEPFRRITDLKLYEPH